MSDDYDSLKEIKHQALKEIKEEEFRIAVDKYKTKIRNKKWWHNIVPYKIVIIRRS